MRRAARLLIYGDEPFGLSFPPVRGVHLSLILRAAVLHPCDHEDDALSDLNDASLSFADKLQLKSLVDCKITQDMDAGHARFAKYVTSKTEPAIRHSISI
ncbi:hypothetical protein EV424DRAFT_1538315 [Suillus variegatus]|nr:hypothetical protein EV424DRAFT_1538315 [Suillus variegatus]